MKRIFISYSHKDKDWLEPLTTHLKVAELEGHFETWNDEQLKPGDQWYPELMKQLEQAQVVIFLVSANSLTSEFILGEEVPTALKNAEEKGVRIIPVLARPCAWKTVKWLSQIQFFSDTALTKMSSAEVDETFSELTETLANLLAGKRRHKVTECKDNILLTPLPMSKVNLLGRERELAELEKKLKETRRILLVNGMGGIGKTEVCKEFFLRHHGQYKYAAWVDYVGGLKESLVNTLGAENSKLIPTSPTDTLETRFEAVKQALEHLDQNALMVVDNVENPEDELLDWLTTLPFKVIANSRATVTGFETFPLDVLSHECCVELFYEHYQGAKDDENLGKIIHLCHRHTLTVELLARLARNAWMEIKTLHHTLVEKGFNLNEVIPDGIETVWHNEQTKKKFFDHLLKVFELSGLTEEEIGVLTNLSVLPAAVPVNDFCEWMKMESRDVLNALVKKGWLKRKGHLLFMHNILQEVIRHHTQPDAEKCRTLINSLKWKLYPEPGDNPIAKQVFVPFADSLLRFISDKDRELATLANNLSNIYEDLGLLPKALEFQLKAESIREEILDSNHPDLATSYNNLSSIYRAQGQLGKALEFQLKAVKIYEEMLDSKHPSLATSYNNLSSIYQAQGQLEKALEFQLKTVKIFEEILASNHPSLATSYNNLSLIYKAQGQLEKALEFQLKTVKIFEEILDSKHPSLATSYNNLSLIYKDLGQLEKALEFQLKAVEIREEILDSKHPSLASSYNNLAAIYEDLKKYPDALEYYDKAITILEFLFPNGHPNLDKARGNKEMLVGR